MREIKNERMREGKKRKNMIFDQMTNGRKTNRERKKRDLKADVTVSNYLHLSDLQLAILIKVTHVSRSHHS